MYSSSEYHLISLNFDIGFTAYVSSNLYISVRSTDPAVSEVDNATKDPAITKQVRNLFSYAVFNLVTWETAFWCYLPHYLGCCCRREKSVGKGGWSKAKGSEWG